MVVRNNDDRFSVGNLLCAKFHVGMELKVEKFSETFKMLLSVRRTPPSSLPARFGLSWPRSAAGRI